jgi:hypothetical protein
LGLPTALAKPSGAPELDATAGEGEGEGEGAGAGAGGDGGGAGTTRAEVAGAVKPNVLPRVPTGWRAFSLLS